MQQRGEEHAFPLMPAKPLDLCFNPSLALGVKAMRRDSGNKHHDEGDKPRNNSNDRRLPK